MRLGISSDFVGKGSVAGFLPLMRELKINCLELYPYAPPFDYRSLDYVREFGTIVRGHGVEIYSMHLPFKKDISHLDAAVREEALDDAMAAATAAAELGATWVVAHPGSLCKEEDKPVRQKLSVESLLKILEFCRSKGLKLAVENMLPDHVASGSVELLQIVDKLPAEVGVCYDTGHAFVKEGNIKEPLLRLGHRLSCLHVHDNDGLHDLHRVPGEGNIPWGEFLDGLKELKFDRVFTMEIDAYKDPFQILRDVKSFYEKHIKSLS